MSSQTSVAESTLHKQDADYPEEGADGTSTSAIDPPNSLVKVPDRSWIETELSPWQELELYFKIVACHASNLSHLLRQRALKMAHLQWRCEYFAWRMRCMSRISLAIYKVIQSYGEEAELSDESNEFLATSATLSLKTCLKRFRTFDSFCRAIPHQSDMDQISWSMVELRTSLEELEAAAIGDKPLDHVVYNAETCILNAIRFVQDAAGGHRKLIAKITHHTVLESTRILDYARIPDFHLEMDQEAHGIVGLKDLPWKSDRRTFVAERQYPRDIEREVIEFRAETRNLLIQEICQRDLDEVWTITRDEEDEKPHRDQPLEETLLVSLNHGRPKKKKVRVSEGHILFLRPNGTPNRTHTSIPCKDILLVTQRPTGARTTALTVFWSSNASPIHKIEKAEVFFVDMNLLMAWKLELARIQESRVQELPEPVGDESCHIGELLAAE